MNAGLMARYIFREILGLLVMGVALFWAAGKLAWWQGWVTMGVMAAWIAATATVILLTNPDLLAERLGPRKGAKPWDTAIMSILGLAQLCRYIVAGLDQRFRWTGSFPIADEMIALVLCFLGYTLVVWATGSNRFFSQIMRIQPERGQTVVTSGPYGSVRHPAYAGAILYELAVPILLASWWAFIPSGLGAILLILRTSLEDRTLHAELAGYGAYASQVRYRLLPGIW